MFRAFGIAGTLELKWFTRTFPKDFLISLGMAQLLSYVAEGMGSPAADRGVRHNQSTPAHSSTASTTMDSVKRVSPQNCTQNEQVDLASLNPDR